MVGRSWCLIYIHLFASTLSRAISPRSATNSGFSSIVVFGASYCDNAHERETRFSSSLKGFPYDSGRYSNGPVWPMYLTQTLDARLYDYAYAGATAYDPNSDQSVPDTSQQVEKYLGDFRDGTTHPGTDRVLYVIWVGINTIDSIWKESEAEAMITTQVQHIGSQMESLVKNSLTNSISAGFVIITLPPLEVVPNSAQLVSKSSDPVTALDKIKALTRTFNQALMGLQSNTIRVLDIIPLWTGIESNPGSYGFSHTNQPCLGGQDSVCPDPDSYLYWDSLHPTTKMHQLISGRVNEFIGTM